MYKQYVQVELITKIGKPLLLTHTLYKNRDRALVFLDNLRRSNAILSAVYHN